MRLLRALFGSGESHNEVTPALVVEPTGTKDFGSCSCCGDNSRTVWGLVHRADASQAAYFVHWTLGQVARHGAHFDLVLGPWGDGTARDDRRLVCLELRRTKEGPQFMIIDAGDRQVRHSELAQRGLRRDEVIGTPLAKQAFDIVDAIWLHDQRIHEIRGDAE